MVQPKPIVGYRFHPTDEELINHYLTNKILCETWLVDEAIGEIDIYDHDPVSLPRLSRIQSDDLVWYFFTPLIYNNPKRNQRKRTAKSGFWKSTGKDRKITDKSGTREIGEKKTLVYQLGKVGDCVSTLWVMHEYTIKSLPHHVLESYVISKIMYKGDKADISYGNNNSGEPSQSLVSDSNTVRAITIPSEVRQPGGENFYVLSMYDLLTPMDQQEDQSPSDVFDPNTLFNDNYNIPNVLPQNPNLAQEDEEFWDGIGSFVPASWLLNIESSPNEQPQAPYFPQDNEENRSTWPPVNNQEFTLQTNYNNHRPKQPLTRIIVGYSSDSDCESYQGSSSPGSNKLFPRCSSTDSCNDLQTSPDTLISRKTQLATRTITEETMERNFKTPQYIYLMNMITALIILVPFIGNIISFFI